MVMKDNERVDAIKKWSQTPSGVLLITYEMFTNLAELTRLKVGPCIMLVPCREHMLIPDIFSCRLNKHSPSRQR